MHAILELPRLDLAVRIGWTDEERAHPQPIAVGLVLRFHHPPAAVDSDRLEQTVDYAGLVERLTRVATGEPYRLVERLAARLLAEALKAVEGAGSIRLTVLKHPQVPGLSGGAAFTIDSVEAPSGA